MSIRNGSETNPVSTSQTELSYPDSAPKLTQKHRKIPISSLIHPTNLSPQISPSNPQFDFSRTPSHHTSESSSSPQWTPATQLSSLEHLALESGTSSPIYVGSTIDQTPAGLKGAHISQNADDPPTVECSGATLFSRLQNSNSPRESQTRSDRCETDESHDLSSSAGVSQGESSSSAIKDEGEASIRQVSIRRTNNPNMKTTKTGKILHKSRKGGVNRKTTAYNKFLRQRSEYLAIHRSELTAQQRMKIIVQEWAISEKNQHKTRRRSRFLGPDGELYLPLLLPQNQPETIASDGGPSNATSSTDNSSPTTSQNDIPASHQEPSSREGSASESSRKKRRSSTPSIRIKAEPHFEGSNQ